MAGERGQSTVEWVGLLGLVAFALAALGTFAGPGSPGAALADAVAGRIACAIGLGARCREAGSELAAAYGAELAVLLAEHAPRIHYESGMRVLPVDYRECREDACAEGAERARVSRTLSGLPVTAFTRVVDCRRGSQTSGARCSGDAAGRLYLQYWLYYPGSATGEGSTILRGAIREISAAVGTPTYHPDDWESLQIRLGPGGEAAMRASSHHGYGAGWVSAAAQYRVSGGSHAGTVEPADYARTTPARRLALVPLEPIAQGGPGPDFAVTPPWQKVVWLDPEYGGTD